MNTIIHPPQLFYSLKVEINTQAPNVRKSFGQLYIYFGNEKKPISDSLDIMRNHGLTALNIIVLKFPPFLM